MKKYKALTIPYLIWMSIFVLIPVIFIVVMAFQDTKGINIFESSFTLKNFTAVFDPDKKIFGSLVKSIEYSFLATLFCLLLGYPVAYFISRSVKANKFLVMAIMILPMWSNTLLRTKVIGTLFQPGNIISDLLSKININVSLDIYGTPVAVIIGLVATYLPFMILPIYTVLDKMDNSLYAASADLGANSFKTFVKVTIPLSLKGVTTGIIMVFLPCATSFGIAEQLGDKSLIGSVINSYFGRVSTYGLGSVVSLIILIVMTISIFIVGKTDKEGETLI